MTYSDLNNIIINYSLINACNNSLSEVGRDFRMGIVSGTGGKVGKSLFRNNSNIIFVVNFSV